MKQETRKILSRIGAGFMLGMSLFNLGAIWTNKQGSQVPSRAKNIKETEKETLDQETSDIASIAERHANEVIMTERIQLENQDQIGNKELGQQAVAEKNTVFQQVVHYGVIAVWTISLGIIFSSLLLDFPISFGDKVLAIIPGISDVATISLEPQKTFFQKNENIGIDVFVEAKSKNIKSIFLTIKFNPTNLAFDGLVDTAGFEKADIKKIDENGGLIELVFKDAEIEKSFEKKQKIASVKFSGKTITGQQEVLLLKEESNMIADIVSDEKPQTVNLLEKVQSAKFSIISEFGKKIRCGSLEGDFSGKETTKEDWEQVLAETKLPKDALVWQEVGDETYFLCALDSQKIFHLLVKRNKVLEKTDLFIKNKKIKSFQENNWQDNNLNLYSFSYDTDVDFDSTENSKEIMLRFDGNLNWPKRGLAEVSL